MGASTSHTSAGPSTRPGTQAAPALRPQRREEGFDLVLSASAPDIFFPRDGQAMGVVVFFQPQSQRPILPIDTLPRDPSGWDALVEGALQHLLRQLGLGGKGALLWHP